MADHTPTNRPPLWRAVDAAWWSLVDTEEPHACPPASEQAACVIRAVRDWLVPEEPPPHRGMRPGGTNLTYRETLSVERQRLRALLTAEIDRAERGEGGNA